MSRIGKKPVILPKNVKVQLDKTKLVLEGPRGKLSLNVHPKVAVTMENDSISVKPTDSSKMANAIFGTTRALISNMAKGVTDGYAKELEIHGVGYKAQATAKELMLYLGFTHPVNYKIPEGITIETPKPTQIIVKGIDKAMVGEIAAQIRNLRKPEPYKGKGIRYFGEYVRKKVGKKVA